MKILAIETSCDETSVSVLEKIDNCIKVKSNIISSSIPLHKQTGGIVPENAAREQLKMMIPVIIKALIDSIEKTDKGKALNDFKLGNDILINEIGSIAVTLGPGLIGSLLVGVETAKTISFVLDKPLIPVHHLLAHLYANFLENPNTSFPFVGLIVSGGHTDLLYFKSHNKYEWLGGTRDDAAGEALDKIGKLLGLSYPAGAEIEIRAKKVNKSRFNFKSPLINSDDFDFSFSGLKTEVMREVKRIKNINQEQLGGGQISTFQVAEGFLKGGLDEQVVNEICFSVQKAIVNVLVKKTIKAAEKFNAQTILLGGGVSANQTLRNQMKLYATSYLPHSQIHCPPLKYCTDNAAMIGAYAFYHNKPISWEIIKAQPELYFE
ncbi:tRNA (adenosine(37)-N6)-threonylcarbamoyltransferase complex transferase subunit TsaD [Candidatus Parcubacteria bacterium]|nr:MAG: tRNA (adenosine(37)-N6)-threonylcarbamoyltransferase complex transferase subunit TsaD [Candidatus Parcubacteria bacterium]